MTISLVSITHPSAGLRQRLQSTTRSNRQMDPMQRNRHMRIALSIIQRDCMAGQAISTLRKSHMRVER